MKPTFQHNSQFQLINVVRRLATFFIGILILAGSSAAVLAQTVTVTSPNGGQNWTAGSTYTITWSISGTTTSINYQLVALSTDGGSTYANISSAQTPGTRSFSWTIPSGTSSTQARIRVRALDINANILAQDASDSNFTIGSVTSSPNLTPYLAPGWSDDIVVSRSTGAITDSTSLTTSDSLYVNWTVLNNGTAAAGGYYVYVYVDGTYKGNGYTASQGANTYTYWHDLSIGTLSAGTHTIMITADATGAVSESNEGDNSYTKTITVGAPSQPNLTPYLISGWSDKIVISRSTGATTDSTSLTTADTLYASWGVVNNGTAAAGGFYVYVYVDGTYKGYGYIASLNANTATYWQDLSIGTLSAGTHTVQITTDATGAVAESNEGDNSYTKTISVNAPSLPNLTPYTPSGWSDKIVVSRAMGNNIDSTSLTTADTLYVDWDVINNGTAATATTFYTTLYIDGSAWQSWQTSAGLIVNGNAQITDFSIGTLSAGTHTILITADSGGTIAENNEGDNSYTKTISIASVSQPNLTPYQPSGWSDKIVVSRAAGNNIDSTGLTTGDNLYIDWAVINNGNAAVNSTFYTYLYVDGTYKAAWTTPPPLNVNYYAPLFDYNLGPLSAGTHTIQITTDATGVIGESSEADNSYTKTISVAGTSLPEFVVTSISLSPSVPTPGQAFTAYVTVKNQGGAAGDGGWLDVWANQSSSQSCGADGNTWTSVGVLTAGQSKTYTFSLTAPASAGAYTFRAFVDSACQTTESNEANNQSTLAYNAVQPSQLPDFLVTSISLNPASPQAGQTFTASVTVMNQGAGAGDGGWLDVWANQSSAPACGTDGNTWASVGALSAGQSKTFTLTLTAAATGGAYTFRAFVDSYCQTTESNEGNNQSTLAYTVGAAAALPDFLVTSISFNPAQPIGGQPFTAYVTVKNQGAGPGDGKYLDVWVNQPSVQSCSANGDQYQSIGTLTAGQSKIMTFNLTALASGAPWTFRAFVDSGCQTTESNDGNNQTTASYGANPVAQPDFLITAISTSPSSPKPGDALTAYVTVKNQGAGSGDGGWLDVWANKPTSASCGDSGDVYQEVGVLAAGASKTLTLSLTAGPAGANTLRAFVDSSCQTTESNEGNNQNILTYNSAQRVLVLLHGMNSDPGTWQDYIDNRFQGSAPIISGGLNINNEVPQPDPNGVICYRVDFGFLDKFSGRTGLEGVTANEDKKGDFEYFDTLGLEVWDAVNYILTVYPGAQITLLGHSRGGIAGRAFLQNTAPSPEKASVVALLTLGTPHKGSPLGKLYNYYSQNPRSGSSGTPAQQDWDLLDELRGAKTVFGFTIPAEKQIDVRTPTVSDLASDSSSVNSLNAAIGNLPSSLKYGAIAYSPVEMGTLANVGGVDISVWSYSSDPLTDASTQSRDFVLGSGNVENSSQFLGDGIVPFTSQSYNDITGFPASSTYQAFTHNLRVLHIEEPGQEAHITAALTNLLNWWQ